MSNTIPYVIVGGGPVGLIAAKLLQLHQKAFVGLEKTDRLGGKLSTLPSRLFSDESVVFFRSFLPTVEWNLINSTTLERVKGEWKAPEPATLTLIEKPFLQNRYYSPDKSWVVDLAQEIVANFQLRSEVSEVIEGEKKIVYSDGKEVFYEKLLWCADLSKLRKAWKGNTTSFLKVLKGIPEPVGVFDLELELATPLRDEVGSILFPFRYKEKKLRAIGVRELSKMHWLVPLEAEIAEDREEVAKCVRTLKRELGKEFSDLKEKTQAERIVFYPDLSPSEPKEVKSLTALPDVLYLGSQLRREECDKRLFHLDVAVDNCRHFEQTLRG